MCYTYSIKAMGDFMENLVFSSLGGVSVIGNSEYNQYSGVDHGSVTDIDLARSILRNVGNKNERMIVSAQVFSVLAKEYSIFG
jgi:hypothetical protein